MKSHEILYNVKHLKFRDGEAKNRLWLKLANELEEEGTFNQFFLQVFSIISLLEYFLVEIVKKKWTTMRDYFNRTREKKGTGSAALSQ